MRSSLPLSTLSLFVAGVCAWQPPICPNYMVEGGGCIRYTMGFDVTGVTTEIDLAFPEIKNECDCIQACLNRPNRCANYVWKFTSAQSVQSGYRTCTLYSNFNLPADVSIEINLGSSQNENIGKAQLIAHGNNPQNGGLVPQAFKDVNLNTTADPQAVSGPIWHLANGQIQC